jgi:alpha-1,2-mannosyltransferase
MVSDSYWKRMTLLGQSYGSMQLAFEACTQLLPDIWIDTMGYAFSYPIVRMFHNSIPIGGYVHYPTISTDMLERVKNRESGHTNDSSVSKSRLRSKIKLMYYRLFAFLYSWALRRGSVLVGNGSWTQNHLNRLIMGAKVDKVATTHPRYVEVVYPPCDTTSLSSFSLSNRDNFKIVSLAQFRPEKEHSTQLRVMAELIKSRKASSQSADQVHLTCMGSCRNKEDEKRVEELKNLARDLEIEVR